MSETTQLDRLVAEEPFVRTLAQSLLAGEADEVVQQTYMRALRHSGEDIEQPRSWLATVVRNVASNLQRDEKRRLQRERDAKAMALTPSSDELMEREEQRQRLVVAIDSLPDQLRSVLLLRFYEGLAPRHIAQKTGLSNDIVRNRIRRALQLLREQLDQDNKGDRRGWMLALVPIACPSTAKTARATVASSATTAITLALLATAALLFWVAWPNDSPPGPVEVIEATTTTVAPITAPAFLPAAFLGTAERTETTPAIASTATLNVRVLHSDHHDGIPAVGTMIYVHRSGSDQRAPLARKRCDELGVASFVDLPLGELWISNDRGTDALVTTIESGEVKTVIHKLDAGVTLTGTVVDEEGNAMPFARIEGSPLTRSTADAQQLGTADALGQFTILDVSRRAVVGARASGHAAGIMLSVHGTPGTAVDVQLTVGPSACDVTGVVRNETGAPVPYASIGIGGGRSSGFRVFGSVHPPLPALAQSDEQGRFEAWGVPIGKLNVVVIARDRAPWQGTCVTHPDASNDMQISLLPGATIEGTVLQNDGQPAASASVEIHAVHRFDYQRVRCDENGFFRLDRLSPGTIELRAHAPRGGGAIRQIEAKAGELATCMLLLNDGPPPNKKRVPRPDGDPNTRIGQPPIRMGAPPKRGNRPPMGHADERGRQPNGPQSGRRPGNGPQRNGPRSNGPDRPTKRERGLASVTGQIVDPDGTPIQNASVFAEYRGGGRARRGYSQPLSGADGMFTLPGMSAGRWRLDIFAHGMPPISIDEFELSTEEQRQLKPIVIPAGGRLRILLPLDYPVKSRIRLTPRATFRQTAVHHVNGARETDFLPAGEYEMTVYDHRIELMRSKVSVIAGKVTELSFR